MRKLAEEQRENLEFIQGELVDLKKKNKILK